VTSLARRQRPAQPSPVIDAALDCAGRGWRVFPVEGKVPAISEWPRRATTDPESVRRLLAGAAGYAIVAGSSSGLVILDVDPKNGGDETLRDLVREHGALPDTLVVITGGGGEHWYFKHPGGKIKNSRSELGDGLDIRGDGGYVVGPGSLHPDTGQTYRWENESSPEDVQLADMPTWLLELVQGKPRARKLAAVERDQEILANPEWPLLSVLNGVPEKQRHDSIWLMCCSLRGANTAPRLIVALALIAASNCTPPLEPDEAEATALDVIKRYPPNSGRRVPNLDRLKVMRCIAQCAGPVWPERVAELLGWSRDRTKNLMRRMAEKYGELIRTDGGYLLAVTVRRRSVTASTLAPVLHSVHSGNTSPRALESLMPPTVTDEPGRPEVIWSDDDSASVTAHYEGEEWCDARVGVSVSGAASVQEERSIESEITGHQSTAARAHLNRAARYRAEGRELEARREEELVGQLAWTRLLAEGAVVCRRRQIGRRE
jgi:hypothetical protein